ncbi:ABC transporter permease [Microbacterium sp. SA39]|uniref:ABC transporter permease n=1 Tax=Microbacterium sp. SA39 TaxID=1263625 RepID=UPI0005F9D200|nr:ABC transporter permease [Microbacterium sp. SA39]KJQ55479.1 Ribose transport system permease protein RbsC [Microbacterium sp. SA39]
MTTTSSTPTRSARAPLFRALNTQRINEIGLAVAIIVLAVVLASVAPGFATGNNVWSILRDAATVGIVAWGATLVIVAGEIDISIGPAVAFWSVMLAEMAGPWGIGLPGGMIAVLVGGLVVGGLAGWLRAVLGIPSFIVTLGLWSAYRGLAQFMTNALPVPVETNEFFDLLAGSIGPVPTPVVVFFLLFVVFYFVSTRTSFGRSVFAVGGNARAAMLSGIHVTRTRIAVFAITGLLAAVVGILLTARLGSGNSGAATGLEFDVIAAVVVGGTALAGGRGSMLGTLLGVIFIAMIGNGLILLGVNSYVQDVVSGAIIVVSVLINILLSRRGKKTVD